MGLINQVVKESDLDEAGMGMAETIATNDRLSVEITKRAINRTMEIGGMREGLLDALEADILLETSENEEGKEADGASGAGMIEGWVGSSVACSAGAAGAGASRQQRAEAVRRAAEAGHVATARMPADGWRYLVVEAAAFGAGLYAAEKLAERFDLVTKRESTAGA